MGCVKVSNGDFETSVIFEDSKLKVEAVVLIFPIPGTLILSSFGGLETFSTFNFLIPSFPKFPTFISVVSIIKSLIFISLISISKSLISISSMSVSFPS